MNKVLIISTEYPPASRSSGVQRIVNFARYLPDFSWSTCVLTMHPRAYGTEINHTIPDKLQVDVKRSLAFNTAVHFAVKGRYLSWMAIPDRWSSWVLFGFFSGLRFIKQQKPTVIFASYPHPSALLLAFLLHKATGLPLIADFRDPMLHLNYSVTGTRKKVYTWIEKQVMKACRYAVFTTQSAIDQYIKVKYPSFESKCRLIENGFDEEDFVKAEEKFHSANLVKKTQTVLLHSGGIFPDERNPTHLFEALFLLKKEGVISASTFKLILRAPGDEQFCLAMIKDFTLEDIVFVAPKLNYVDALVEMLSVDGLVILQGSSCNFQVPAKIYEYFRTQKPIMALTDKQGETANVMLSAGFDNIAALNDTKEIMSLTRGFIQQCRYKEKSIMTEEYTNQHSRKSRTEQLAQLLNSI